MTWMVLYRFYHKDVCVAHMYYVNCPVVDACMYLTLGKWLRQEVRASVLHIPEDRWAYKRHRVELEICMIRVRTELFISTSRGRDLHGITVHVE